MGLDLIQLEASAPSVWIQTNTWMAQDSRHSYVQLPPSDAARQILHILRTSEIFKIGDKDFVLQAKQTSPEQEVQVTSSRPNESKEIIEDALGRKVDHPSGSSSSSKPGTPHPASGPTVMETPVTDRRQPLQQVEPEPPSPNGSSTPMRVSAMRSGEVECSEQRHERDTSDDPSEKNGPAHVLLSTDNDSHPESTKGSAVVPISFKENLPPDTDGNESSQTTESCDNRSLGPNASRKDEVGPTESSHLRQTLSEISPGQQNTRKRSASHDLENDIPSRKKVTNVDLESAPGIDDDEEESVQGPPRKQQKGSIGRRGISKGADESQNSVRSTIHVEVPHRTQSLDPVAESSVAPLQEDNESPNSSGSSSSEEDTGTKTLEPPSSIMSTRSTDQARRGQESPRDRPLRVYYSSSTTIQESSVYSKFLRQHNVKQVKKIIDCDIMCVGKGELKRTPNLIHVILKGKDVVSDKWVIQSNTKKKLLEIADFVPESPARARKWGTTLSDAIDRGRRGEEPLQGWTINFTPSAKKELGKSWSELKDICIVAGATVHALIPSKPPEESDSTIVIVASHEPDESTLEELGWKLFSKDIITFSVLRGELDAESDEFLIKKGGGKGRKK